MFLSAFGDWDFFFFFFDDVLCNVLPSDCSCYYRNFNCIDLERLLKCTTQNFFSMYVSIKIFCCVRTWRDLSWEPIKDGKHAAYLPLLA